MWIVSMNMIIESCKCRRLLRGVKRGENWRQRLRGKKREQGGQKGVIFGGIRGIMCCHGNKIMIQTGESIHCVSSCFQKMKGDKNLMTTS